MYNKMEPTPEFSLADDSSEPFAWMIENIDAGDLAGIDIKNYVREFAAMHINALHAEGEEAILSSWVESDEFAEVVAYIREWVADETTEPTLPELTRYEDTDEELPALGTLAEIMAEAKAKIAANVLESALPPCLVPLLYEDEDFIDHPEVSFPEKYPRITYDDAPAVWVQSWGSHTEYVLGDGRRIVETQQPGGIIRRVWSDNIGDPYDYMQDESADWREMAPEEVDDLLPSVD